MVEGRSAEYSLAFDRPIDMIDPICPLARRIMNRRIPMKIAGSRIQLRMVPIGLDDGVTSL